MFLVQVHKTSPMPGFRLDFSAMEGVFIIGMMEAKYLLPFLSVFPFLGAIMDRMTGEAGLIPVTALLTY